MHLSTYPINQINPNLNIQAQPIDPDLTAKLLGRGVAVSPIVTVEPRRRKFHKAITLSMPAPKAHSQGMINQYSGNAPTLRLLCSITGKNIHFFQYLFKFMLRFPSYFTTSHHNNNRIISIVLK